MLFKLPFMYIAVLFFLIGYIEDCVFVSRDLTQLRETITLAVADSDNVILGSV